MFYIVYSSTVKEPNNIIIFHMFAFNNIKDLSQYAWFLHKLHMPYIPGVPKSGSLCVEGDTEYICSQQMCVTDIYVHKRS